MSIRAVRRRDGTRKVSMTKSLVLPLLFLGSLLAGVSPARAEDAKTKAAAPVALTVTLSTKEKGPAMTEFGPSEAVVVASFTGDKLAKGDKVRVDWIVESSKGMATPNKVVYQNTQEAKGPNTYGSSSLNKPANGWPLGKYRADVFVNNAKVTSVKFTIK